jgi:hypothetical protein
MNEEPKRPAEPQESHVILNPPRMSDESWKQFINRLMLKQSMRRQPTPRSAFTMSFGDQPDFFIVVEFGKG